MTRRPLGIVVLAASLVVGLLPVVAADEPVLTKEETRQFLLKADIVKVRNIGRGVTGARRLTLTDGRITHDAGFNTIEQRKSVIEFDDGGRELNFVDSYHYNIGAFLLAELLGLDHMMPVTVERTYRGEKGSLSWWIEAKMDEAERLKKKIQPPDPEAWNQQMYRMRVFSKLVYDTDRHLGQVLITPDWKLWMMDFTRAFRLRKELKSPGDLPRCDRKLLESLKQLERAAVEEKTRTHVTKFEVEALMARRDLIVAHFERLIAEKGEAKVLY